MTGTLSADLRSEQSDGDLLQAARQGDQDAAALLYDRYSRRLKGLARSRFSPRLARRLEPDDIVQSVFRRLFTRASAADYSVPEGSELWGLLLVIAANCIRSAEEFHHAGKRDARLTASDSVLKGQAESEGEGAFLNAVVNEALERLPPACQRVARLRIAGHEVEEIAEIIGRSLRTTERLLQECRSHLEGYFDGSL